LVIKTIQGIINYSRKGGGGGMAKRRKQTREGKLGGGGRKRERDGGGESISKQILNEVWAGGKKVISRSVDEAGG